MTTTCLMSYEQFCLRLVYRVYMENHSQNILKYIYPIYAQFFQGYETTATSSYALIVLLSLYPEYQEKIYEEICQEFPDWNDNIENGDLNKLTYLDKFIKEAQRLLPAIPYITRIASKEIQIGIQFIETHEFRHSTKL